MKARASSANVTANSNANAVDNLNGAKKVNRFLLGLLLLSLAVHVLENFKTELVRENGWVTASSKLKRQETPNYVFINNVNMSFMNNDTVIYGHIHMAKTAGTDINGKLALRYERVCGHKGYSYDAFKTNERNEAWTKQYPNKTLRENGGYDDSMTVFKPKYNRGRVPNNIMDEIGYHDCDWISNEKGFKFWQEVATEISPVPLELHVPCRDPIDYILSMCNHRHQQFMCNIKEDGIPAEAEKCLSFMNRFDDQLDITTNAAAATSNTITTRKVSMKCFNPIPIDPYLEYMGTKLQPKRLVRSYVHRTTNTPRHKDQECLRFEKNGHLRDQLKQYLAQNIPIFRFCHKCVGSKDDLFAS